MCGLHLEESLEDLGQEVVVKVGKNADQELTRAVGHDKGAHGVRSDGSHLGKEVHHAHVGIVEVHDLLLVDILGAGNGGLLHDLVVVDGGPVEVLSEVLFHGTLNPGLDDGHLEAVGEDVGLEEVADGLVAAADVDAGGGSTGHEDEVETHKILHEDVVELDKAGIGLGPGAAHHGGEVLAEVAKELLADGAREVGDGMALVIEGIGTEDADLGTLGKSVSEGR